MTVCPGNVLVITEACHHHDCHRVTSRAWCSASDVYCGAHCQQPVSNRRSRVGAKMAAQGRITAAATLCLVFSLLLPIATRAGRTVLLFEKLSRFYHFGCKVSLQLSSFRGKADHKIVQIILALNITWIRLRDLSSGINVSPIWTLVEKN